MYSRILHFLHERYPTVMGSLVLRFGKRPDRLNASANYQPLPWINLEESRRTEGTYERWEQMRPYILNRGSLLDIGCSVGFFVFKAVEQGMIAWGIDGDLESHLISLYARKKSGLLNAQFQLGLITPDNVESLPTFNTIIFLSVFHHWCRAHGLETSRNALETLISRSNRSFFFEMGQDEMDSKYNLPDMQGKPKAWLHDLLRDCSAGRDVSCLGQSDVLVNKGRDNARRYLFMVGPRK